MKKLKALAVIGLIAVTGITFASCGKTGGTDYGELSIEDVKVYINYDKNYTFAEIEPEFTKSDKAEALTFTYDETALKIENNIVTPKKRADETYSVKAKSEHFEASFNVEVEYLLFEGLDAKYSAQFDLTDFQDKFTSRGERCASDVTAKTTLFLGDSFMDDMYIGEYMTEFKANEGKDVVNAGINSTTSYHWEREYERVIGSTAPKNIVFHIGTNNFYDVHDSVEETEASLCRLMMFLHTSYPTSNIYWFNITQRKNTSYASQVTETNNYMKTWCAKYDWVICVDTSSKISTTMLREDEVHPKKETYQVFIDTLGESGCVMENK